MDQPILCLTDSNFSDHVSDPINIENNVLFLVDFWADWCNPCKIIAPIIEEIANEFNDKIKVIKLNIDSNPITTKHYGIKSIPTLLLIKKGVVLSTQVGLISKNQLRDFINTYL